MLKKDELAAPTSCLNKADPLEPIFVLRAKDPRAAQTIRHWAAMAVGVHEDANIAEAYALADQMDAWQREHTPPAPEPEPAPLYRTHDRTR